MSLRPSPVQPINPMCLTGGKLRPTVKLSTSAHNDARQIVIVKSNPFVADIIGRVLGEILPAYRVSRYYTGEAGLRALRESPAWFCILGMALPDIDGLTVLHQIVTAKLADRVLVVSMRSDEQTLHHLRTLKIHGWFDCTTEKASMLPAAIQAVANGETWISEAARRAPSTTTGVPLIKMLTPRELNVLSAIGDGSDDRTAALALGLSHTTVHFYRQRIMRKLDVHTATELMRAAIERGVIRLCGGKIHRITLDPLTA